MMDKELVIEELKRILYNLLQITVADGDVNLFSSNINISPVNMVYLLLELEKKFAITIDDRFMDELPNLTINHLADAICICSK
jgi:acyl carrier protein